MLRALALLALATLGCGGNLEGALGEYEEAVVRALGATSAPVLGASSAPVPYPARSLVPPRRRERRLPVDEGDRIGVLDFLSLQGCRLGELAGFRNSPMGRVMEDTRRLVYELDVAAAGAACLADLEGPRRERLAALLDAKREQLPRHLWNATLGGEEFAAFLSPSPAAGPRSGNAARSLRRIRSLLAGGLESPAAGRELESALADLARSKPLGPELRTLDRIGHALDAISGRLAAHPVKGCAAVEVRLTRAFQNSYLNAVQPLTIPIDRVVSGLLEPLAEITQAARAGQALPEPTVLYLAEVLSPTAPESVWVRYRTALRRHAAAWEPVLRTCGVLPEPPAS